MTSHLPLSKSQSLDQVLAPNHLSGLWSYLLPYTHFASGTLVSFLFRVHAKRVPIFTALHVLFPLHEGCSCIYSHGLFFHFLYTSAQMSVLQKELSLPVSNHQPIEKQYTHLFLYHFLSCYTSLLIFHSIYHHRKNVYTLFPFLFH